MIETQPPILSRTDADVSGELSASLEAGLHVTAAIDPLADDSLVPAFFNESPHLSYEMLFLQTPLEHVLQVTPYLVDIKSTQDAFCRYLLGHRGGWGFFAVSAMPLKAASAHWKSLLRIHSDNAVTHFRFYDGQVLHALWPVLSRADAADLLGPHACLYLPPAPGDQGDEEKTWSRLSHPSVDDPQAIAGRYAPRESPWWSMTAEHWAAFADKRPGIMANNIKEFLFEAYPSQAGAQHARVRLDEFCLAHLQRAESLGIHDEETAKYFVACCLLYGEQFPEGADITISSSAGQEPTLASDLRSLCEKAVSNE